ncbi:actin cytoskeleton organization protein [Aspergillus avenaceus]|uniref:Actin cytoskeleton organization protein n=1 Tax=Aspergillus avenaceus TaxID=36643 RepID=A0A5N6TS03_ASPAV|nr:actin cytoskeleton organization protein [Aspergillus avenaceus]
MVHSTGEERAVHLTREAIELVDSGHREAASRNLREALSIAPNHPSVKEAFLKIQQEEESSHHLLDLCRRYTSRKDESAGKDAALYLRTDGLKPPEGVALECAKLLLAHRAHTLSSLQDDIISGLVRQNASVRQFFSDQLQISVTTFFDEMYDRGDGAAVCLDTVVLDSSVWPSEDARSHCERELFLLFIAKLMESGHDLDGRSLKGIARLLAVDASKLQDQIDDEELDVIITSLDHRLPLEWRSQATLATVKYLEASMEVGQNRFTKLVSAKLTKGRVDDYIVAFSATAAVFPVIPEIATSLFLSDSFKAALMPPSTNDAKRQRVEVSVLELLNAACISKVCRETISKNLSDWLSHTLTNGSDLASELAAVVLAKVRASEKDGPESKVQEEDGTRVTELVDRFKELISNCKGENVQNILEGLAFSSVKPTVKEQLAKDSTFLRDLITLLKGNCSDSSVLYGGLMIISNLVQFLPNMTEEQKKMSQLKSYAEASPDAKAGPNPLENDDHVIARCNAVIQAGIMPLFVECGKTSLPSVQGLVSKIMLSLARNPKTRGTLAQQSGVKLLLSIGTPRQGSSGSISNEAVPNASHALARILISVNPSHVFPPSGFPPVTSAIRPLTALLAAPEAPSVSAEQPRDLLPVFESLLALTNLASHPDDSAPDAIVRQAWSVIEDFLLSSSPLIQRAACELVCNLMTCESGVGKFTDGSKRAGQRLHILLALTDVDAIATRRAAGGALAMLTEFDASIAGILDRPRGTVLLLRLCQEDDEGLLHRGVACVRNMSCIASGDIGRHAREALKNYGAVDILTNILKKSRNPVILQTGVEALKPLVE